MASRNIKKKRGPIRLIIRISSTGARLTVPPDDITLNSTLAEVASRVELPPLSANATLVCLRKVATYNEWSSTTLKQMLDGDDGSAGVLLTLDLGSGGAVSNASAATTQKTVIEKAAASLNIKPEPMDISEPPNEVTQDVQSSAPSATQLSSQAAWSTVLSSNFDTTTKSCLLTLLKIIDNILSKSDPKVRTIRYGNPNFQQRVVMCKGAVEFMYSLGFVGNYPAFGNAEPENLELKHESRDVLSRGRDVLIISAKKDFGMEEDELPKMPVAPVLSSGPSVASTSTSAGGAARTQQFDIYKGHSINIQAQQMGVSDPYANKSLSTTERQLQNLEAKKKNMEKKLQYGVEMDRCLVAYLPGKGPSGTSGGSGGVVTESKGDSSLVAARMKRMEEERKKREEGGFTTKAMRDLERMKKAKVYSHAQIRINFPDGTHLHAKFLPTETISTVRTVIQSSFNSNCHSDFDLYVAPPRRLLDDSKSLEQEELVPAAKIHVSWKSNLGNMTVGGFLRPELFNANNNENASFPEAKSIIPEKKAPPSASSSTVSNDPSQSKEDMLMARMMGKGLLGGKKKSSSGGDGEKKGKPKWFK